MPRVFGCGTAKSQHSPRAAIEALGLPGPLTAAWWDSESCSAERRELCTPRATNPGCSSGLSLRDLVEEEKGAPAAVGEGYGSTTNRSQGCTRHCVPELQDLNCRVYIEGRRGKNRVIHLALLHPKLLCLPPLSYSLWLAITSESNQKKQTNNLICFCKSYSPLWKHAHKWLPQPPTSALTTDPLKPANLPALLHSRAESQPLHHHHWHLKLGPRQTREGVLEAEHVLISPSSGVSKDQSQQCWTQRPQLGPGPS